MGRSQKLHKSGKGYVTGKIQHGRKSMPVHISCKGKISLTKQGRRTWYALKKASRCKAAARLKAHKVKRVHHRKPKRRTRRKPCGCVA